MPGRGDRGSRPTCGRRRTAGWRRGRRCRGRRRGSASPRGSRRTRRAARGGRAAALRLAQPEQLERREERVGDLRRSSAVRRSSPRRVAKADRQEADALGRPATSGRSSAGAAFRAGRRGPASADRRRTRTSARVAVERVGDERLLGRRRQPRVGAQLVEAEARRRLQRAVSRVVLEEQRAASRRSRRARAGAAAAGGRSSCGACASSEISGGTPACRSSHAGPRSLGWPGRVSRRVRCSHGALVWRPARTASAGIVTRSLEAANCHAPSVHPAGECQVLHRCISYEALRRRWAL